MLANYHTHTKRCHHAGGTDEEYVKYAIKRGLSVLGFSDHTPYFYDGDYYSHAKMRIEETEEYVNSVLSLKSKYKNEIDIRLGFETEYFPKFFQKLLNEYRKYPLEYIILGQHYIGNESTPDAEDSFTLKTERKPLTRYTDQCIEALNTGRFSYFAHPDVVNYHPTGREDAEFMESEYERLIRAAILTETPLELNLCGIRCARNYPNPAFWRLVGKFDAPVVIGCDAHAPYQVADAGELKKAEKIVRENGLKLIDSFPLKNPIF